MNGRFHLVENTLGGERSEGAESPLVHFPQVVCRYKSRQRRLKGLDAPRNGTLLRVAALVLGRAMA
jgi:hypothetical protein